MKRKLVFLLATCSIVGAIAAPIVPGVSYSTIKEPFVTISPLDHGFGS